ncbi:MAG TPA: pitrilysin family protein [Candidatus Binataceae bacterium]|nr:pitrilysin family protein [Candidatus Binataceae bacterium]
MSRRRNMNPFAIAAAAALLLSLTAAPSRALEIKRMTLSNGAILLVSEQHQLPMVTIQIAFDAGARRDPQGKAGLASLTADCLTQGTTQLTAEQFSQQVDFMGSSVSVDAGRDYSQAGLTSLTKYEDKTLDLLAAALEHPGLRDTDIIHKRDESVADIRAAQEDPDYVAGVAFRKQLFGDTPYGNPEDGTADSVAKLTPDDVRNFYKTYYKMGAAVIAVTGDVNADNVKAELEKKLASLDGTVTPQSAPPPPVVAPGIHPTLINRDVAQATLILGFGGVARSNPDYYRLQVMNYILGGGGFASRLTKVVRSKAGLVYDISSGFEPGKFAGAFSVNTQTRNASSNDALRLIVQQLRAMQQSPVSDDELASAHRFLIGSFPLKIDRQSAIASFMLQVEIYGLGMDYAERYPKLIGSVTREDVQRVARQYLHPDSMVLIAVANQAEAKINVASLSGPAPASMPNAAAVASPVKAAPQSPPGG